MSWYIDYEYTSRNINKSVCYLKRGHLLAALVNPLAVHRPVDADCLVLGPAGLEY